MDAALQKAIEELIGTRFEGATIDRIDFEATEDSDGDPVLWITIVFDSEMSQIKSGRMAGLARHLRPALIEQKEERFPMVRFMSKRDHDRLDHVAA
ncbi:hypothetical protein [Sphingomonas sp.]|uniref:hypothetical protein n=1 Tax=Sphingomonas sp. TaxID=28214 RepID=UPI001DDE7C4F|nr:hypothetical protein [Sphingomonas sp.]MBX9797552.1 hypothetical protein [Sphingomonas sp.]